MRTTRALVVIGAAAALQVATTSPALADASGHASCLGLESSSIAPAGSTDEFPGGRSELSHFVKQLSRDLGVTPGAIVSPAAHVHAGSHAGCDAE